MDGAGRQTQSSQSVCAYFTGSGAADGYRAAVSWHLE